MEREASRAHSFQLHVRSGDRWRRPRVSAAGAVVVAEMTEVDRIEHVRDARSVAAKVRDRRVIAIEHQLCILMAQRLLPALSDRLELAVAIELITEQISEQDRSGVQLRRDRG